MVTYLVGTDGRSASAAIGEYLAPRLDDGDHVEVVTVLTNRSGSDAGEKAEALDTLAERFAATASVTTERVERGERPVDVLLDHADRIDADQIVTGLRRHSRTERIVFGSVAYSLLGATRRPVTLVPLPTTRTGDVADTRDLKTMY